jgi:hypothetical protein
LLSYGEPVNLLHALTRDLRMVLAGGQGVRKVHFACWGCSQQVLCRGQEGRGQQV